MTAYLLVFLGAGIGGAMRHGVNTGCARWCGLEFPWGTLTVNVAGSFAMGLIAGWLAFFSAYSLDAVLLWERGQIASAALYVAGSVILSITALAAGLALIRTLT